MSEGKGKANPKADIEFLHVGLVDMAICTRLSIEEALRRVGPSGTSGGWQYEDKEANHSPCPDGQGKTHYRLIC